MLMYDYIVTFPYEVRLFRRRKATGATFLVIANRYLTLFYSVFQIATAGPMSDAVSLFATPLHSADDTNTACFEDVRIRF